MPYDKELITHKLIRWEEYLNHYKLPAWKELPDIGLYMDQVIALLAQYLDFIPVEDQKDKPVTPTTINNYVRLKVMPAPEKRRYYRVHIAFLIMIFTLKQGISIGSLQKLLPSPTDEEGVVAAFYTNYIQQVREIGSFYTAQTRAAVQDILDPQVTDQGLVEKFLIQSILQAGFSRILAEKILHLRTPTRRPFWPRRPSETTRAATPWMPRKRRTDPCCLTPMPTTIQRPLTPTGTRSCPPSPAAGVGLVLCPGCDLPTSRPVHRLGRSGTPTSTPPRGSTPRMPWACQRTGWTRWRP